MSYTVCAIKPYNGLLINHDGVEVNCVNDLNKFYEIHNLFQNIDNYLNNLLYVYDEEAMMYLYRSAFQEFIGENPMNMEEGIAWKNISSYPFRNWSELEGVLYDNYQRAINDTNDKLSETQLNYAGQLNSVIATGINSNNRMLQVYVTIEFVNLGITKSDNLNLFIAQKNQNVMELIKGMINGK